MPNSFIFPVCVYLEDTDVGGLVYHANYLKFAERARTEALRSLGFSHSTLMKEQKIRFVIRSCHLNCLAPAHLDDILHIKTYFKEPKYAKLVVSQIILREDHLIASLEVTLACINSEGKPVRIVEDLHRLLTNVET